MPRRAADANELSPTEADHLRLLLLGLTAREAGKVVFKSPRTVEDHRAEIKRKIGWREYRAARIKGEQARESRMISAAA